MDPRKQAEIRLLADTVRESLDLGVPIDVEMAVQRLGGEVIRSARVDPDVEAKVARAGERFKIFIQKGKPEARQRFSIAHELGHLFLHMGYLIDPDRWSESDEYRDSVYYRFGHGIEEEEANEFAAAFLMPEDEFRGITARLLSRGPDAVDEIARHFATSRDATVVRGNVLGIFRTPRIS